MFCKNCGVRQTSNSQFCSNCNTELVKPIAQSNPATDTSNTFVETNAFVERIHKYGASSTFFMGAILYTVGSILSLLLSFSFANIFSIALLALPIVGVWMVYNASTKPKVPEATLTALTLFKVATIIGLVSFAIGLGIIIIAAIIIAVIIAIGNTYAPVLSIVLGVLVITGATFALCIAFYYVALLRVFKSIRNGILDNTCRKIRGVTSFSILSYIGIGLGILTNIALFGSRNHVNNFIHDIILGLNLGPEFYDVIDIVEDMAIISPASVLLSLASSIGMLMLIFTLNKFANSIRRDPVC